MSSPEERIAILEARNRELELKFADEQRKREEAVADERRKREEAVADEQRKRDEAVADEQQKRLAVELERHELRELIRSTTLSEYLGLCHTHISGVPSAETNSILNTTGFIQNPVDKKRPDYLRPWKDFPTLQNTTLDRLFNCYPPADHHQVFDSRRGMEETGAKLLSRLTSEKDLEIVSRPLVITPVDAILEHLKSLPQVRQEFHLDSQVYFFNHLNPLKNAEQAKSNDSPASTTAGSSRKSKSKRRGPNQSTGRPKTPSPEPSRSRGQPDIVCFYSRSDATATGNLTFNKLVLPMELKPPHKLTRKNLELGLRPTELLPDIINLNKIPLDTDARVEQESRRRVAAATTQLFSYMVEGGVEYGILATGEAFVFLHTDLEDPRILYYYCVNSANDQTYGQDPLRQTAVAQVLAFMLLALESSRQNELKSNQKDISAAFDRLSIWPSGPTEDTSPSAAPPRTPDSTSPLFPKPRNYKEDQPPTRQSLGRKAKSKSSCNPYGGYFGPEHDREDPAPPGHKPADVGAGPVVRKENTTSGGSRGSENSKSSSKRPAREQQEAEKFYPYCTSACILSLANYSSPPDINCPNYPLHSAYPPLSPDTFLSLLQAQLHRTRDQYIYPLGIQGAVGVLFKIALEGWGYILVAKGTVDALEDHLIYESHVYSYLKPLQGIHTPACLGHIRLSKPYYYDIGVQIRHLLLLSHGGDPLPTYITRTILPGDLWWHSKEVKEAVDAVLACGIDHQDIRIPNLLWDENQKRVIVIDFERSVVMEDQGHKKRKRGSLEL